MQGLGIKDVLILHTRFLQYIFIVQYKKKKIKLFHNFKAFQGTLKTQRKKKYFESSLSLLSALAVAASFISSMLQ